MSSHHITPAEVIEVKAAHPDENILSINISKINKSKDGKTQYIPLMCKRLSGPPTLCALKLVKQIIASNGKIAYGIKPEEARDVRIVFRRLTTDDMNDTDYPVETHKALLKFNRELCDAIDILVSEYMDFVKTVILKYHGAAYRVGKQKKVHNIKQSMRDASDEEIGVDNELPEDERKIVDGQLPLPTTLYRTKLPANHANGQRLGQFTKKGHRYNVFDARKVNKANKFKPVVAKVRSQGRLVDLTTTNAKHFITYMSLVGGILNFECICLSTFGISLITKFRDLHVWPHKPMKTKTLEAEDFIDMAAMGASGYKSDEDIDEPKDDADPEDDFDEEPRVIQPRRRPTRPARTTRNTRSARPRKVKTPPPTDEEEFYDDEPEDEPEDNEDEPEDAEPEVDGEDEPEGDGEEPVNEDAEGAAPRIRNRTSKPKAKPKGKPKMSSRRR